MSPNGFYKRGFSEESGLFSVSGEEIALKGVSVTGELKDLFLKMRVVQSYENHISKNLEIVHSFPLAAGARLMAFKVRLNGEEREGVVYPKRTAEAKYENSIDEGDAPALLRESSPGLYTVNLGNVKLEDRIEVEFDYVELQRFEGDRVLITIPTTVAPRYGDLHKTGELLPHESVESNLLATYPLKLQIDILGELKNSKISSYNHRISMETLGDEALRVEIEGGATLDRDFVLSLENIKTPQKSFCLRTIDDVSKKHILLSSFRPRVPEASEPLALKILLDCSGSMNGSSIEEAKEALSHIVDHLTYKDYVSLSVFGSSVRHLTRKLLPATSKNIKDLLGLIHRVGADMGGTELIGALESTITTERPSKDAPETVSLLLITDGEVADAESITSLASSSSHKIFTLGMGYSPHESLLTRISEATEGASEMISPRDDIRGAIERLFRRLRVSPVTNVKIDFGEIKPSYLSSLPGSFFNEETINVFSLFQEKPEVPPELSYTVGDNTHSLRPLSIRDTDEPYLPRFAAAIRFKELEKELKDLERLELSPEIYEERRKALSKTMEDQALKYGLVTSMTSVFLENLRSPRDKTKGIPELHNVPQEFPDGYHGIGSVAFDKSFSSIFPEIPGPDTGPKNSNRFSRKSMSSPGIRQIESYSRVAHSRKLLRPQSRDSVPSQPPDKGEKSPKSPSPFLKDIPAYKRLPDSPELLQDAREGVLKSSSDYLKESSDPYAHDLAALILVTERLFSKGVETFSKNKPESQSYDPTRILDFVKNFATRRFPDPNLFQTPDHELRHILKFPDDKVSFYYKRSGSFVILFKVLERLLKGDFGRDLGIFPGELTFLFEKIALIENTTPEILLEKALEVYHDFAFKDSSEE